jgi:hypothetical protein
LRNGILGGEVIIKLKIIDRIVPTGKSLSEPGVSKLALINELGSHNLAIYLKYPVAFLKAFVIKKAGKILMSQKILLKQ